MQLLTFTKPGSILVDMTLTPEKRAENAVMWHLHTHNNREKLDVLIGEIEYIGIPRTYIAKALNRLYKQDKVVMVYHSDTIYKVAS